MNIEKTLSDSDRSNIRLFLMELLATHDMGFVRELADTDCVKTLLSEHEIVGVQESDYSDPLPSVLLDPETAAPRKSYLN